MNEGYTHIGALLRAAREERRLTVSQASEQLHIRARYLEALEEGRISDIPGVAYAKGYLQAYAGFLQLDRAEILRRFEQMEGVLGRKGFFLPQVFSKETQASRPIVMGSLLAAVLVYVVWLYVLKPDSVAVSVVDVPPGMAEKQRISAPMAQEVSCLKPVSVLYPPCHSMTRAGRVLPMRRQYNTIMELANGQR